MNILRFIATLLMSGARLAAHDMWIEPTSFLGEWVSPVP